jgi:hypothetical protein
MERQQYPNRSSKSSSHNSEKKNSQKYENRFRLRTQIGVDAKEGKPLAENIHKSSRQAEISLDEKENLNNIDFL